MRSRLCTRLVVPGLAAALALAACGDDSSLDPARPEPMSDFSLPDVNATSPTFGTMVSPRDFLEGVSAWYFGHAT